MKGFLLAHGLPLSQSKSIFASLPLPKNAPVLRFVEDNAITTKRFLVEFKDSNNLANGAADETAGFMNLLASHGIAAEIAFKYSPIIFHGVSISLSSSSDLILIQELAEVSSVRQVKDTKATDVVHQSDVDASNSTSKGAVPTTESLTFKRQAASLLPPLVIQKSRYQYTANTSSVTFTHAKKNARASGLITATTPVYAVFFSLYFIDQFKDVYLPVYETAGNSGDFKLERLPASPTGQVNIILTTADGITQTRSAENTISGVGMIEVLPVGQRDPYPTSLRPWTPHSLTGVDKLHSSGIRGKGVKIGLIDGGIDYTHPALGGGFGEGFKVVGGYDFVGNSWGVPWEGDTDPKDACSYSTAWGGIVFAEDQYTKMVGVAPDASIYAYKTTNCFAQGGEDVLLAALQRAYDDDVDIISISPSSYGIPGGPENPISLATARLVAEGIFVSTPSLNTGNLGPFTPSSATLGKGVAAAGSIDLDEIRANVAYATITGKKGSQRQIPYLGGYGIGMEDTYGWPLTETMSVIAVAGSCTLEIPANTPDLSKYTVIVPRDCPWDEIATELGDFHPEVVLVYNTDSSQSLVTPDRDVWTFANMASISYEDGMFLIDTLKAGSQITIEYNWFPGVGVVNKNQAGGMSDWSAWGPNYDGGLWPQIVAPGNRVMTTYHLQHNSFLDVAGTSAAQSYITGVAALYYSQHGGKAGLGKGGAQALVDKMILTASPVVWQDGTGMDILTPFKKRDGTGLAPVAQQGGGLISATALLSATTTVTPSYIKLGDKEAFKPTWSITVSNPSSKSITYSVAHDPSVTFLSLNSETEYNMRPLPGAITWQDKAALSFSETSFTLAADTSTSITVTITPPPDSDTWLSKYIPVYSGYVTFASSTSETLHVPYQGINTNLRAEVPIWHEATEPYPLGTNYFGDKLLIPGYPIYTWQMNPNDDIILMGYNTFGSDEMRIDIVNPEWTEDDWSYPPQNNFVESVLIDTEYSVLTFPLKYISRTQGAWEYEWAGYLANGSLIADGRYKIVMSTLLPRGNQTQKSDWQIRETNLFDIEYYYPYPK